MIVLLASRPQWSRRGFLGAGVIIGVLGIAHAHPMLTGLALGVLALPPTAVAPGCGSSSRPPSSGCRWRGPSTRRPTRSVAPRLDGADSDQPWPWFWLRNVGLFLPLFAGLAVLGGAPHRLRRLTTPLWLWFIVPNLIAFHPSEWNNTKYFLFWQCAGCLLIASWLSRAFSARDGRVGDPSTDTRCGSSPWRASCRSSRRRSGHRAGDAAVDRHPVGRARRCGRCLLATRELPPRRRPGVRGEQHLSRRRAQRSPCRQRIPRLDVRPRPARLGDQVDRLGGDPEWWTRCRASIDRYGVDYVVMGPIERSEFNGSDDYWMANGSLVFEQGDYRIYRVTG